MIRFPWIHMPRKTDPELPVEPPILLGNRSNGESFHEQTARDRRSRAEILRRADLGSRRLGIERRDFLASALGMATSLWVINLARTPACRTSASAARTHQTKEASSGLRVRASELT